MVLRHAVVCGNMYHLYLLALTASAAVHEVAHAQDSYLLLAQDLVSALP